MPEQIKENHYHFQPLSTRHKPLFLRPPVPVSVSAHQYQSLPTSISLRPPVSVSTHQYQYQPPPTSIRISLRPPVSVSVHQYQSRQPVPVAVSPHQYQSCMRFLLPVIIKHPNNCYLSAYHNFFTAFWIQFVISIAQ